MAYSTTYLYVVSVFVVVLILLLAAQLTRPVPYNPRKYSVVVDTPRGLISMDSNQIADELQDIRQQLVDNRSGAHQCKQITVLIDDAMRNLTRFVNQNPRLSNRALCQLELRADVVHQFMSRSINPDPVDWENEYKQILEWEAYEEKLSHDPKERLVYLIKNIDICIAMLRGKVCDHGKINLTQLYYILRALQDEVCRKGSLYIEYDQNGAEYTTEKPSAPFSQTAIFVEAMGNDLVLDNSRENPIMEAAPRDAFANVSFGEYDVTDAPIVQEPSDTIRKHNTSDSCFERDTQIAVQNRSTSYYKHMRGSTLLDRTVEGSVERDILQRTPTGYTVSSQSPRNNRGDVLSTCLGKTPADADLWTQCVSPDISLRRALQGDSSQMISHLDESLHV